MATTPTASAERLLFFASVAIATALALWLRAYGITTQVLLDDEWHAVHKLLSASYSNIFRTVGVADHSIPLTLLYKAMADTVGLGEGRMRALQVACGVALVPVSAWLAWRASRDAPAAALLAFLVSGAPFLVMWSRFARPYSITLLLSLLCVAAIWGWRAQRSRKMAVYAALTAALSAWLHPISGVYAAIGCLFVFLEDVLARGDIRPRPSWSSLKLGLAVAGSMLVILAAPLIKDRSSLSAKAGGDQPGLETFERMLAIIWGGVPTLGTWCAHLDYHWDYRYRWMMARRGDPAFAPPEFYRKLGRMPPGSAPVVEAPFNWEAPYNPLAYYATFHQQREIFGMIHDLCLDGPRIGEVPPRDRRLRFSEFVFLEDVASVKRSGARYLLLHRRPPPHVGPVYDDARCLAAVTRLYGAPVEIDARLAVFDLRPGEPPPGEVPGGKLQ